MDDYSAVPRPGLARWLRTNLSVTMAIWGIACASGGGLITGTWRIAHFDFRLDAVEVKTAAIEINLSGDGDRRAIIASDFGLDRTRLGILESQMKFVGDLAHDTSVTVAAMQARGSRR